MIAGWIGCKQSGGDPSSCTVAMDADKAPGLAPDAWRRQARNRLKLHRRPLHSARISVWPYTSDSVDWWLAIGYPKATTDLAGGLA
jgi:hypothetical protein